MAIVNLQKTCKDRHAQLLLHAKCDDVMRTVISALRLQLPVWKRVDTYLLECVLSRSRSQTTATLSLLAADGLKCPLPMLMQVSISIQVRDARKAAIYCSCLHCCPQLMHSVVPSHDEFA